MTEVAGLDARWLATAVELSRKCPISSTAYSVGAVLVDAQGTELSRGFSRENDPTDHAEESALHKLAGIDLRQATIYTSMEPCSQRASRLCTCTELILAAGIPTVVYALREPPIFVECDGVELLTAAGVRVVEIPTFADDVRQINAHVLTR